MFVYFSAGCLRVSLVSHPAESSSAQLVGKGPRTSKVLRADRFAKFARTTNLSTVAKCAQERRTLYSRHRLLWTIDRMCPCKNQDDNIDRQISHWSEILNSRERNLDTKPRECRDGSCALVSLHPYLEWTKSTIRTSHDALRKILTLAEATGKLARWRLQLIAYDFHIVHRAGFKHQTAVTLSRLTNKGAGDAYIKDGITIIAVTTCPQPRQDKLI